MFLPLELHALAEELGIFVAHPRSTLLDTAIAFVCALDASTDDDKEKIIDVAAKQSRVIYLECLKRAHLPTLLRLAIDDYDSAEVQSIIKSRVDEVRISISTKTGAFSRKNEFKSPQALLDWAFSVLFAAPSSTTTTSSYSRLLRHFGTHVRRLHLCPLPPSLSEDINRIMVLNSITRIESLVVSMTRLLTTTAAAVVVACERLQSLTFKSLSSSDMASTLLIIRPTNSLSIYDAKDAIDANLLQKCPNIERLVVRGGSALATASSSSFFEHLGTYCSHLTHLEIMDVDGGHQVLPLSVSRALCSVALPLLSSSLVDLTVSAAAFNRQKDNGEVDYDGVYALFCSNLPPNLRRLHVGGGQDGVGVAHPLSPLAAAIGRHLSSSLQELSLVYEEIDDSPELRSMFSSLKSLRRLKLQQTLRRRNASPPPFATFLRLLTLNSNETLEFIDLSSCYLGDAICKEISDWLAPSPSLPSLRSISLQRNLLSNQGRDSLLACLSSYPLLTIDLTNNRNCSSSHGLCSQLKIDAKRSLCDQNIVDDDL